MTWGLTVTGFALIVDRREKEVSWGIWMSPEMLLER